MHTIRTNTHFINYSDNFNGQIIFVDRETNQEMGIDFSILKDLVARALIAHKISNLQNGNIDEILGFI